MPRITFSTLHDTTMRNLQRVSNKLNKLDEQMMSGKKITRPSDNPVGFAHSLAYNNSLSSLGQKRVNMDDGQAYMDSLERTAKSMVNLFANCRDLAVQASNDTVNHPQRLITNLDIRGNLEQLVAYSQTRHKDNYIFSGKWTNMPPYEIKKGMVSFTSERYNEIDNPNYIEAMRAQNRPTPNPSYVPNVPIDPDDRDTWTVFEPAEPIKIPLWDNAYLNTSINNYNDAVYPEAQRIIPGSFQLLNDYGLVEKPEKVKDFPPLNEVAASTHPDYNKADYEVDYENGVLILISDKAKAAFYDNTGNLKDAGPNSTDKPPELSFDYVYCNPKDMSGEIYREIDTGITVKINSNPSAMFGKDGRGETDAFKELIHLMQGLWYNDQSQIAEGIDTIDVAHKRVLAEQTIIGGKQSRLDSVYDRNLDLSINETEALGDIVSVDYTEALTKFNEADLVYNASLYAASVMLRRTLMDYL